MNRKSRISLGPGAASLILIVVILSMSVLGILALMSARNDMRLSERSVQVIEQTYLLSNQAEETLSQLDGICAGWAAVAQDDEAYLQAVRAALPMGVTMTDREIAWEESDGTRTLDCAVTLSPLGANERLTWTRHSLISTTEESWN